MLTCSALLHEIKNLFTMCLYEDIIPSKWNNAITTLLHKKGDITEEIQL